jgi:ubiquinone/menaquinone biosynthesis C-methylase UbiE
VPSTFNARDAGAYEQMMGRWSRRLAPLLVEFAGVADGERVLDVGCGTGSLTFALPKAANLAAVTGIDYSETYLDAARAENEDPRIAFRQGDACALPFADGAFDRALALLVLQFIPEPELAVAEMRRVVRPGGTVAAAVWDHFGGFVMPRMFWDTAAVLDPAADRARAENYMRPVTRPNELRELWLRAGFEEVRDTMLAIRMEYASFDDFWSPLAAGEGSMGKYATALDGERREALERALRAAYEAGHPDGPRSFAALAWACRGVVP